MPTGCTAKLMSEGQTFHEFIMQCARNFGALIMMRDDPWDAPIPDKFEPYGYHAKKLIEAREELKRLNNMSDEEKVAFGMSEKEKEIAQRPVASQIQSQYEGERNVLLWVANQFSTSRKWLTEALCSLKIGQQVSCTASFGSEFFIEDERSVLENFKLYKEAGASQGSVLMRNKSLIQASTKGKPSERERLEMLEHLEPLPTLDLATAQLWTQAEMIEFKQWDLKLNFAERINKFERENGSILSFELQLEFKERINKIKSILYSYGKDKKFSNGLGSNKPTVSAVSPVIVQESASTSVAENFFNTAISTSCLTDFFALSISLGTIRVFVSVLIASSAP